MATHVASTLHQIPAFKDEEFPTELHLHHAISRSLARGDEGLSSYFKRPPLPVELVETICRLARFTNPRPTWSWSKSYQAKTHLPTLTMSWSSVGRTVVYITEPLSGDYMRKAAALQLKTVSKMRRGHVPSGSDESTTQSWFEVGIMKGENEEPPPPEPEPVAPLELALSRARGHGPQIWSSINANDYDGEARLNPITREPLLWVSHHNAHEELHLHEGIVFDHDHEIWHDLKEGDTLGVWMCGRYSGWQNSVQDIVIESYQWFEPTLV